MTNRIVMTLLLTLATLAGQAQEGIADTYWRNEATGDWMIGFAPRHVICRNQVWDITSQTVKKDAYKLTLSDGTVIRVGKLKKGRRAIAIGAEKAVTCSPITGESLPGYPVKDLRTDFVDNGYAATDSVTIIGWLKDMPEVAWQRKGREFDVMVQNILNDKQESSFARIDSLGRFTLRMPLLNSSQAFLDWKRLSKSTILEPGKIYFFLCDFKARKMLWMGDDVRVQNELLLYPHDWNLDRISGEEQGKISAMDFKLRTDGSRAASLAKLEAAIRETPTLSQRYIDYVKGYYQNSQGDAMMLARFAMPNYELPQEYMDYVGRELWPQTVRPYTLYHDFSTMMRDYMDQLVSKHNRNTADAMVKVIRQLEGQGVVTLTDEENEALNRYLPMQRALEANLQGSHNGDDIQKLVDDFNEDPTVKKAYALFERIGEPLNKEMATYAFRDELAVLDSVGCDRPLRDIYLARSLYRSIDVSREPLPTDIMAFAEQQIQMPAALSMVKTENDKYLAIQNREMAEQDIFRSSEDVANMSDGEKILSKITEPYRGRIILLDIWGTWCGPCKEALSHSQEEYERLKDYDLVYLYLANRSSDESWKNVIKQYNVTGPNVVHYNLPDDQQAAVEHFLNIHGWPTYKLIGRDGRVLDVNADPHDLGGLARLLDKMK